MLAKWCAYLLCCFWQFHGLNLFEQALISNSSVLFCWQWMVVCLWNSQEWSAGISGLHIISLRVLDSIVVIFAIMFICGQTTSTQELRHALSFPPLTILNPFRPPSCAHAARRYSSSLTVFPSLPLPLSLSSTPISLSLSPPLPLPLPLLFLHITSITHILHIIHIELFCCRNSKSSTSANDKDEGCWPLAKTSKTDRRLGSKTTTGLAGTALEVLLLDSYRLSVTELQLHRRGPGQPPVYCVMKLLC